MAVTLFVYKPNRRQPLIERKGGSPWFREDIVLRPSLGEALAYWWRGLMLSIHITPDEETFNLWMKATTAKPAPPPQPIKPTEGPDR